MERSKKEIKVAVVDNSIYPEIYTPVEHWAPYLGNKWVSFKATKSDFPNLNDGFSHIILTGSEASILQGEKWVYEEIDLIHQAVEKEIPILGSCYGHQLIALALVGDSSVRRSASPEAGWISITINKKHEIFRGKKQANSFTLHFDEVFNLPDSFEVLAFTKQCSIQAFQMREKPIWGFQIHPEIDIISGRKLLEEVRVLNPRHKRFLNEALESTPRDSGLVKQIIKVFLET